MSLPTLKLYQAASILHDSLAVESAHAELLETLGKHFDLDIRPISEITHGTRTPVLFIATGGVEEGVREALGNCDLKRVFLVADGLQNSLAASMEIAAWLKSRGTEAEILHGTPQYIAGELSRIATTVSLKGCRVGQLGNPSGWLISSNINYDEVSDKYGIEFVPVALSEIEDEFRNAAPAAVDGIYGLKRVEPTECDLEKALKLTTAIENIVRKYHLDAFSLKCFDLLDTLKTTGCLALAVLNAKGIPAGCEGDMPALLTMLLAQKATGAPGFMSNPSRIDSTANEITIAHCTLPLNMPHSNILRSHFESGIGVALQGILPLGEATIVKWWGKGMDEYFVSRARLIENLNNPSMCRTQIRLKVDEDIRYFLTRPLGNHHVVLLGNHVETLKKFFAENGVIPAMK